MNIALGALIITLLLLPALFFRIGMALLAIFSSGEPSEGPYRDDRHKARERKKVDHELIRKNLSFMLVKLSFSESVLLFLMIPLILHLISLFILHQWHRSIDYTLIFNLFASQADVLKNMGNDRFQQELESFLEYSCWECGIALLAGWGLGELFVRITWAGTRLFLSSNIWYQLFTGLALPKRAKHKVDVISVEVLCQTKEASVIYSGVLGKFDDYRSHSRTILYYQGIGDPKRKSHLSRAHLGRATGWHDEGGGV